LPGWLFIVALPRITPNSQLRALLADIGFRIAAPMSAAR
jgi:hypothetical protein